MGGFAGMGYTISQRISTGNGLFTAVVCAIPQDHGAFAVVRAHDCDSQEGARSVLQALVHALGQELSSRGDAVLAVEPPEIGE